MVVLKINHLSDFTVFLFWAEKKNCGLRKIKDKILVSDGIENTEIVKNLNPIPGKLKHTSR